MNQQQNRLAIDWQRVRQRLLAATAATEAASRLSPERAREIMDARAAQLARDLASPVSSTETLEAVMFNLAEERYLLETYAVREVQRAPVITLVPGTPAYVLGVTNLRGEMLAVVDLGEFFGLNHIQRGPYAWLMVLGVDRAEFGIVCDAVHEVTTLRMDAVLDFPATFVGAGRQCARGVTRDAAIVLDAATLLADQRLYIDATRE